LLSLALIGFTAWRINIANQLAAQNSMNPFFEEGTMLWARLGSIACAMLILSALNAFYMNALWHGELQAREGLESQFIQTLISLSKARDNETGNHTVRTQNYVKILAEHLQRRDNALDDEFVELVYGAAPLHDIGKIGIPDEILLKPGSLDDEQWRIMKTHAMIGENVLTSAALKNEGSEKQRSFLRIAREIAGAHHEHWDGSGYPRGFVGEEIPLSARLMSVADCYDALTSARSYKRAWLHEDAVAEIRGMSGTFFDPDVIGAFVAEAERFREIAVRFRD
jgi:response regulator RpfG family c-di-GMP phosphodiesterase